MKKRIMGFLLALGLILPLASISNVQAQGWTPPMIKEGAATPTAPTPTVPSNASQLTEQTSAQTQPLAPRVVVTPLISRLKHLNRACLPVEGRMLKDERAACHCPPESLCPQSVAEWKAGESLPPSIANICCTPPKQCIFERILMQACGTAEGLDIGETEYCHKWEVSPNNGAFGGPATQTPEYTKFNQQVGVINARIAVVRAAMKALSDRNDTSGVAFTEGQAMVKQITDELANIKVIQAEIEKFNGNCNECNQDKKLKLTCDTLGKTTFCLRRLSQTCPPDPVGCVVIRGTVFPDHGLCTDAEINSGQCVGGFNMKRDGFLQYEDKVKKECPIVTWTDCVIKGTMVTMADGTLKNVEDVKTGDMVMGYNAINKVMGTTMDEPEEKKLYSLNGGKLILTGGHPVLTTNGWKAINPTDLSATEEFKSDLGELKVGDEIIINSEATMKLETIFSYVGPKATTHNLTVGGDRTFIANGVVIRAYKFGTTY